MTDHAQTTRQLLQISCADALELMTWHLEGALSSPDARRMLAHLEGCEACGVYLDQLETTIRICAKTASTQPFELDQRRQQALMGLFGETLDNQRCNRPPRRCTHQ